MALPRTLLELIEHLQVPVEFPSTRLIPEYMIAVDPQPDSNYQYPHYDEASGKFSIDFWLENLVVNKPANAPEGTYLWVDQNGIWFWRKDP